MTKRPKIIDAEPELTIDQEFEEIHTVLDAYANEVGMMRQFNRQTAKNIANLMERVKVLEEERAEYEKSIQVPEGSD